MSGNRHHHVCIHGHFYQPPRENPWLEIFEPQPSATPYRDWNTRIAAECYTALTQSRCHESSGDIHDLFNCFAHLSFNLGPTLYRWLEGYAPATLTRITHGESFGRDHRHGYSGALAQAYNHTILPLANARDRHTQIIWGLADFAHRYGHAAEGMWLPECAIDMPTIRNLIDHRVRFVILSPEQASFCRPLGESEWKNVSSGNIDTRQPYRVYEVDAAGRTHFDRALDIFFYDPNVSLKVSFEQLPNDPARFVREVEASLDADADVPQLVLVATDGEAYGHHTSGGEVGLAQVFSELLAAEKIHLSTLSQYLGENPPGWEVKLWAGEDGRGSSWSCRHGVGRWHRDCGCNAGGGAGWQQTWREPLRDTLDVLCAHIDRAFVSAGAKLFRDSWAARDGYIDVLLNNTATSREAFLAQHLVCETTPQTTQHVWTLLEASRNALLLYTSCGWFFDDISGLEPVQNLRYALRAAELIQPWCEVDLTMLLRDGLATAPSNEYGIPNGQVVFDREVITARCEPKIIAAGYALTALLELSPPQGAYVGRWQNPPRITVDGRLCGTIVITDSRTTATWTFLLYALCDDAWAGVLALATDHDRSAVDAGGDDFAHLDTATLRARIEAEGVLPGALPLTIRTQVFARLRQGEDDRRVRQLAALDTEAHDLLTACIAEGLEPPQIWRTLAEYERERRLLEVVAAVCAAGHATPDDLAAAKKITDEALALRVHVPREAAMRCLSACVRQGLVAQHEAFCADSLVRIISLFDFALATAIPLGSRADGQPFWTPETAVRAGALEIAYWQLRYDAWSSGVAEEPDAATARAHLITIGRRLGFADSVIHPL